MATIKVSSAGPAFRPAPSSYALIGAELVLRRIARETCAEQIILPAQLVVRESTAPPRVG